MIKETIKVKEAVIIGCIVFLIFFVGMVCGGINARFSSPPQSALHQDEAVVPDKQVTSFHEEEFAEGFSKGFQEGYVQGVTDSRETQKDRKIILGEDLEEGIEESLSRIELNKEKK